MSLALSATKVKINAKVAEKAREKVPLYNMSREIKIGSSNLILTEIFFCVMETRSLISKFVVWVHPIAFVI